MARMPRYVLPGQPQHVIQRGNNREIIFVTDDDHQFYRDCLRRACEQHHCAIHAYVFMTNHVQPKATDLFESLALHLDGQAILTDMHTHGTGRLQSATYGNGLPYRMRFDAAGRPAQQQRGLQSIAYHYDKNGNTTRL